VASSRSRSELGVDIATVSGRLGHNNLSFTLAHYAPYLQSADDGAAFAIDAAFDRGIRIANKDAEGRGTRRNDRN